MLFDDSFERDKDPVQSPQDIAPLSAVEHRAIGMTAFLFDHAGASYQNGLYRIPSITSMERWTGLAIEAFPYLRGRLLCFGFDWLGRMFSLDFGRMTNGQCLVMMLEPGTGQALEVPVTFMDFHNNELVQYRNEAVAMNFYEQWCSSGGKAPMWEQCIGYKNPLFLNGGDVVENLEAIDMEVYWSIAAQLLTRVRQLPEGSRVRGVSISE